MNYLQLQILFFIDEKLGPNKNLYYPFQKIYLAAKTQDHSDETILNALSTLTDDGYLETTEGGYRITTKGFIYIEAYEISSEIMNNLHEKNMQELKSKEKELEEKINKASGYQWAGIAFAFIVMLILVLATR